MTLLVKEGRWMVKVIEQQRRETLSNLALRVTERALFDPETN